MDRVDELLTPDQVSEILQVGKNTLANRRSAGVGIPWVKIASSVRYKRADVDAYIAANRYETLESLAA